MTAELLSELRSIIERYHDYFTSIKNSEEFYFKKGQEQLRLFDDYQVNDVQRTYLLQNKKEYQLLKSDFENKEEYREIGRLIFSLVSYCDENAPNKIELNKYKDHRTLAKAGLYMNDWVKTLIDYKFGNDIPNGVVKNALNYLKKPADNFTMLSENHRKQFVENLIRKEYNSERFKEDVENFFAPLEIKPVNRDNYTCLISSLCYTIKPNWVDSIIGLVTPDGTAWQDDAIESTEGNEYIILWNHRKPNGKKHTLGLLQECINDHEYFRIFYTSQKQVRYIAEIVAFASDQEELEEMIKNYEDNKIVWHHKNFVDYSDKSGKVASWVYLARKIYQVNPMDYQDFIYYRGYDYPSVGSQSPIVSLIEKANPDHIKKSNKMNKLLQHKKQIILQGPPGTGKTRMAKIMAADMLGLTPPEELINNEQFEIIQFHPSYTYEDFVRGIAAKPNVENGGEGIIYEAENRILGEFAKKALDNYLDATKSVTTQNSENKFKNFINHVIEVIAEKEKFMISDKVYIDFVDDKKFKYKGDNWTSHPDGLNMNFSEIEKILKLNLESRQAICKNESLNAQTRQHASYFQNVIERINALAKEALTIDQTPQPVKNYVLVIDEMNRANLPAVLGELIYGLEYRGEKVKSIYAVGGDKGIILPPNLYIIGTMNTADRSVSHIDYAVRRRFAFVEVLPENLKGTLDDFHLEEFTTVSKLFIEKYDPSLDYMANPEQIKRSEHLTNDFEPKDIWLGHSYFIQQYEKGLDGKEDKTKPIDFNLRVKYEILPILKEYVKDGILKQTAMETITKLECKTNA